MIECATNMPYGTNVIKQTFETVFLCSDKVIRWSMDQWSVILRCLLFCNENTFTKTSILVKDVTET